MKSSHHLLKISLLVLIGGMLDTARTAYQLRSCLHCSAPAWIALRVPGMLYVFPAGILLMMYAIKRQKKLIATLLALGLLLMTRIFFFTSQTHLTTSSETSSTLPTSHVVPALIQPLTVPETNVNPPLAPTELIENYLEMTNNAQLKYPRLQERYFCGYEEFDRQQEGNQTISYGWQYCSSFFIQQEQKNCPEDETIRKACFAEGDCSACEVTPIPKKLIKG